jgi:hypothetical protein
MNERLIALTKNPNFEQLCDDVWVIHDFTTIDERNFYIALAENALEDEWWQREPGWWNGKFLPVPKDSSVPYQIVEKIKSAIGDPDQWTWGSPASVHRIKPGEKMFLHADNPNEKSGLNNWVDLSFVLYHNEFNGGEIIYPQLNFEYHPKPGDLLMHPGSQNYLHGTNEVLPGPNRYNSTMWAYDNRAKKLHEEGLVYEGYKTKNQLLSLYNGEKPNDIFSSGEREPGNNV